VMVDYMSLDNGRGFLFALLSRDAMQWRYLSSNIN